MILTDVIQTIRKGPYLQLRLNERSISVASNTRVETSLISGKVDHRYKLEIAKFSIVIFYLNRKLTVDKIHPETTN